MPESISRREALRRLALVGAGLPLLNAGNSLGAAEKGTEPAAAGWSEKYSLGVAAYSVRGLPLEQALQAVRRVGLEYISVHRTHLPWENSPAGWEANLVKFKTAGVKPLCCGVIYLKNDEAVVRNAFEYARTLGVSTIACSPDPDALPLVERYARLFDFRAAIHNHGPEDKDWSSPEQVWRAVQPLDSRIGLCLDVGHAYRAGADPADCIRRYRARLYDMHLKDSYAIVGAADTPAEVGRGHIDMRAIVSALRETGYDHTVWFEYEKDGNDPIPGLAESVGYFRGLVHGMGSS